MKDKPDKKTLSSSSSSSSSSKTPTKEQLEEIARLEKVKTNLEKLEELKLVNKLNTMFLEAATFKEQISKNWEKFVSFLRGEGQWPKLRPSHKVSAVFNFLLENIERKTALLSDAKPIPKVTPRADAYQDTADLLNIVFELIFQDSSFLEANKDLIENAQVFGTGFLGTYYDKEADFGSGEIIIPAHDPRACYFDPMVLKSYLLTKGEFFITEDVWSLEKARDVFPDRADEIKPNNKINILTNDQRQNPLLKVFRQVWRPNYQQTQQSLLPRVSIKEFWWRDRSKDSNGNYKFRNASRKTILINDSIVVDDGDNPYYDSEFPVEMLVWHTDFESGWGWGDVELLKSPQEVHNKLIATILENLLLMSNAIWIGDENALSKENWRRLTNAPGSIIKKRPGTELRREQGVAIPEHIFKMVEYIERADEKISGLVDVLRGIRTGQVSSGVGIESLQLMAQALIRLRSRSIEALHERLGRKIISRIFQYYEPKKIFEILKLKSDSEPDIKAIESELLKQTSKRRRTAWKDVIFKVEPGSMLSITKTQRQVVSFKLREIGAIDDKALLDDLEYPNREKVLARVEKKRQDAANKEIESQQGSASTQFPHQKGGSPAGRFM